MAVLSQPHFHNEPEAFWLGGKAFEATGSYDWMWWADIALCLAAAAVHLPIREPRPVPAAAPA